LSAFLLNDIPWFLTEGKLTAIFIKTFSWVFLLAGHFTSSTNANKLSGTIITVPSLMLSHICSGSRTESL
jgi:hypothetical protein